MAAHVLRSSFNGGEISPLMDSRVDAEKYGSSCRILENFIPRIYGGAFRRVGTMYLGGAGDQTNEVRLFPFNFSGSTAFVIEVGDEYMRFWKDGEIVLDGDGDILELVTPWTDSQIFDVQMVQLNDVCFFTHSFHRIQLLTRYADNDWRIENMPFTFPSLSDQNTTAITGKVYEDSGIDYFEFENFDADEDYKILFDVAERTALDPENYGTSDWIGTHLQVVHRRDNSYVEIPLDATANSSELRVVGDYEIFTYGTWNGLLLLEREVAGSWETIRSFESKLDRNFQYIGEAFTEENLRLNFTYTSKTGTPRAVLEASDSRVYGLVKITERVSIGVAKVEILSEPLDDSATTSWSMEAWNGVWGYPAAIAFHEQRLIFGGTKRQPTTFWGSQTGDFINFERTTYDDGAFAFTLAAQEGSAIQSILSHANLILFTETEEWSLSTSEKTALTPTNPYVRRHSRYGSAKRQAIIAGRGILFLERGSRKIREYSYNEYESTSVATDLTLLSEHITASGIKQYAFQSDPDPVLWCVLNNGGLVSLTLEGEQNVIAWSKHSTNGLFESVAITYGDSTNGDEVWLVISREVGGETKRYIERFDPESVTKVENSTVSEMIYADSAVYRSSDSGFTSVTGLDHLEGLEVSILGNGNVLPNQTVSNGRVSLGRSVTKCVVGLPYTSTLQTSRIEIGMDDGTAQGRTFNAPRATVNLWKSLGLQYADTPTAADDDWFSLAESDIEIPFGDPQTLFTGEKDVVSLGNHGDSVEFSIRQRDPLPANVLGMVLKVTVEGG